MPGYRTAISTIRAFCKADLPHGLFALFVPPQEYIARMTPQYANQRWDPIDILWQQLAILKQLIAHSAGRLRLCLSAADIERCREDKVLAMVAHIEGAGGFDGEGRDLQAFYAAGVRSIGPFWNIANRFGSGVNGSFPGSPDTGPGLTSAGIDLIKQVNALKMQMDVSHMNEKAFWDTAHHATSPLVATHSNAHALCPQPRNLTDQQLRAIRDSGGVVGVNFGNAFLRADGKRDSDTPLTTIVRHIDYLINIMGEDHVALGSDFDGITLPDELGDVAGLPRLINTLRASGYDQLVLDKLLWRNWLRVLKNVWQQ